MLTKKLGKCIKKDVLSVLHRPHKANNRNLLYQIPTFFIKKWNCFQNMSRKTCAARVRAARGATEQTCPRETTSNWTAAQHASRFHWTVFKIYIFYDRISPAISVAQKFSKSACDERRAASGGEPPAMGDKRRAILKQFWSNSDAILKQFFN